MAVPSTRPRTRRTPDGAASTHCSDAGAGRPCPLSPSCPTSKPSAETTGASPTGSSGGTRWPWAIRWAIPRGRLMPSRAFLALCRRRHWSPAFYQVTPDHLDVYARAGLRAIKVGEDAQVASGRVRPGRQEVQEPAERPAAAGEGGRDVEEYGPDAPPGEAVTAEMAALCAEWRRAHRAREGHFAMGGFAPGSDLFRDSRYFVARDGETGRMLAFASFVPVWGPDGDARLDPGPDAAAGGLAPRRHGLSDRLRRAGVRGGGRGRAQPGPVAAGRGGRGGRVFFGLAGPPAAVHADGPGLQLPGAARVQGQVRDPLGTPLSGLPARPRPGLGLGGGPEGASDAGRVRAPDAAPARRAGRADAGDGARRPAAAAVHAV